MKWLQLGLFDRLQPEPQSASPSHQVEVVINDEGQPALHHTLSNRYLIFYSSFVSAEDAEFVRDEFEQRCDLDSWWNTGHEGNVPAQILNHCHTLLNKRMFGDTFYQQSESICRDCLRPIEVCTFSADRCDVAGSDIAFSDRNYTAPKCISCAVELSEQGFSQQWDVYLWDCPMCHTRYSTTSLQGSPKYFG